LKHLYFPDRVAAVGRLADDTDVLLRFEQVAEAVPDDRMVSARIPVCSQGNLHRHDVPLPVRDSREKRPPIISARSAMS